MLVSKSSQLALILKEMLKGRSSPHSKKEFIEAVSSYLHQKSFESSTGCQKCSKVYFYGEKHGEKCLNGNEKAGYLEKLELQEKQLKGLKSGFIETKLKIQQNQLKWEEELRALEHHIQGLELAASSYHKVLEENRLLYNQVQDLKGSIRVYCRVRPFLPGQSVGQSIVDYIGENGNIMIANPHKQGKGARRVFSFNKVLGTNVTQEEVFADARPLIRSVLDGYNVCIFAYGQTGSGKTYTMSGPDLTTKETWGVNYRSLSDLFQLSKAREDTISYDVSVQMIEIYNEQVRDLLVSDGSNRRLDIRNNSQQNGLNVPDASLVSVCCTKDVLDLMRIGQKNRAVGTTALNIRSSRSHSVLTVHVHGKELVSGSILRGCLHLVDLAGSERVDKSEAVGERLKEAQHINRSLSALGDVIAALAQKSAHIPYRNSKLTQVLQDSLGGHAKALMFVHINSEVNALGETISTLKFAERVASIELGAACANKESGEITELKEEISKLKAAVENKETELEQLKGVRFCGISQEVKKPMTISPLQRFSGASLRPEINQRPLDEAKNIVVRSISSGKQRGSRFPFGTPDKYFDSKSAFISNTRFVDSMKSRSPSPPVRRSISTDRGTLIRSNKSKLDTLDEQPEVKLYIPSKTAINKSVASNPILSINENPKGPSSQEVVAQNGKMSDMLYHQQARSRKVYPEQEEDQFKVALNVRHGGIRKSKPESTKTKFKYQLPTRIHKSDAGETWQSEVETERGKVEESRKSHFSEAEKGIGLLEESPIFNSLRVKKVLHNFSRISPNIEQRVSTQEVVEGKHEKKLLNGVTTHQGKEGRHVPDFRQSRSSPRGSLNI